MFVGLKQPVRAAGERLVVGDRDVGHAERDDLHAVAVGAVVLGDVAARAHRAGQHEPDAPLLQDVGGEVAQPGLKAGIGDLGEAECVCEDVGGLGGVADPQLEVVDAVQGHVVAWRDLIQGSDDNVLTAALLDGLVGAGVEEAADAPGPSWPVPT